MIASWLLLVVWMFVANVEYVVVGGGAVECFV